MDKAKFIHRLSIFALMLLFSAEAMAAVTVTGTVRDSDGPVIGAAILVRGTTTGTSTDAFGAYSVSVANEQAILDVSFLGYQSVSRTVGERTHIDFVLVHDAIEAEELVVVGYGVQQKSHLTGSVSRVGGGDIADMPVSDVASALQGKITGLNILNTTSEVGVSPQIRVRGVGSLSANSSPLVVIDGFPIEDGDGLSMVNPADIESIEVLKDAASAAIYGSRGANGVILVTTKTGVVDKPSYSVKLYSGVKYAYKLHDLYTSSEYDALLVSEGSRGGTGSGTSSRAARYIEEQIGATNWQELALRELTTINSIQASVSGGSKDIKYYLSGSMTQDQGLMLQNQSNKINIRSKVDATLAPNIKVGVNMSGSYSKTDRPQNSFIDFYRTPSFLPAYHNAYTTDFTGGYTGYAHGRHFANISAPTGTDSDGNPSFEGKTTPFSTSNNNPLSILNNTSGGSESFQTIGNAYFDVELAKGLNFRTSNGYNFRFQPSYTFSNANATKDGEEAEATYKSTLSLDLLTENILSYNWNRNGHAVSLMAGYTAQKTRVDYVSLQGTGFPTNNVHTLNAATVFTLINSSGNMATGTEESPRRLLESYLSRVNYSFQDKYLFSASLRLDRNSRFREGYRNGWFPSTSLGWRISEEKFMSNIHWLDMLKVRASYGATGNDRIDDYAAWNLVSSSNYVFGEGNGSLVGGMSNTSEVRASEQIGWEQTDEWNYGVDFSILGNRVNVTLDTYYSLTRQLLMERSVPSFTGFSEEWSNIGRIRNRGAELTVDFMPVRSPRFEWTVSANIATNDAIMLELNGQQRIISYGERDEQYLAEVGSAPIQFYGFKTIGVWNSQAEINANPHFATGVDVPGGLRVLDADGNGILDDNDRVAIGSPYADFTWGFNNTFKFRNFDLAIMIQGSQGGEVFNGDGYYNESLKWNKAYVKNRWVSAASPGDGKTPYYNNGVTLMTTDYFIEDASYACLRSVTLGYTFSKQAAQRLNLGGLRAYVSGNNLLYFWSSEYRGINPESRVTSGNYEQPLVGGYQRGGYPITSTVTLGLDLKF